MCELGVKPDNSLHVGDGGSDELRWARGMGMRTVLAVHVI
jgi:FMN phosphatase YigB (HAD superfamily)